MKRFLKYSFLTLLVLFLIRGWLFRHLVSYHSENERPIFVLTNPSLSQKIENQTVDTSIQSIVRRSLIFTSDQLRFTFDKCDTDPNLLFASQKTNCTGYAAFFNTTCQTLLRKEKLENRFRVKHLRGKLTVLGFDLHQLTSSPFFRDHDYNVVEDLETGKKLYMDASLQDVIGIGYVNGE
ncbi:MAG: hypothetical protein K9J37_05715 [Saprospiraceae bacterium]|nr:hypothetical protein [Saprospiraceae bacterium]MCF8249387.1 hypothetical protein [Saprospiraceae bacterium]MCF8279041.1 hypothetical protein [Bacteroidales bacterium]MCF8311516.1 hypothetical protein [Saprospiraceae bacterium]MCF8440006.1 hypothetical protein [Saprospiraceae bacterium]